MPQRRGHPAGARPARSALSLAALALLEPNLLDLFDQLVLQREQLPRPHVYRVLLPHARIPPAVQALPEPDVPHADHRLQHHVMRQVVPAAVQRVPVLVAGRVDERPQRNGAILEIYVGEKRTERQNKLVKSCCTTSPFPFNLIRE